MYDPINVRIKTLRGNAGLVTASQYSHQGQKMPWIQCICHVEGAVIHRQVYNEHPMHMQLIMSKFMRDKELYRV